MGQVLQFEKNFTITELFLNMNRTQHDFNRHTKDSILQLKKQNEWLKASIISLLIFTVCAVGALAWSIHDFKTKPVTVLLENQVQELDKLPLPPLEEIKGL
jgi:hypothetical protein